MQIELQGLTKRYGDAIALDDVWLEIAPGEIVAIVGANGAGKTTLLRCLAGINAPTSGTIRYDGETFRRDRLDLRKRLFLLSETPFLFHHDTFKVPTLIDHVSLVLDAYELDETSNSTRDNIAERVVALLDELKILPHAENNIASLSRGQLYKGALAALLAVDPQLWLLDEPLASGMDPSGISVLKQHCRAAAKRGRTILFTTQIMEVAQALADRICILHEGRVVAMDTVEQLRLRSQLEENADVRQILEALCQAPS